MIEKAYFTISEILKNADIENEIIFVDDGSSDNTYERIKTLADKVSNISGLHFSRNFGKEAAISAGLAAAEGTVYRVGDLLLVVALLHIDASVQYPMVTGGVMIISTLICFFDGNRPSRKELLAVLLAFCGTLALFLPV